MKRISISLTFSILAITGYSQLLLDTTFQPTYAFYNDIFEKNTGIILGAQEEDDGRLVVYGDFKNNISSNLAHGIRLDNKGKLDPTWMPPHSYGQRVNGFTFMMTLNSNYYFGSDENIGVLDSGGNILMDMTGIPRDPFFCGGLGNPYFFNDGSFLCGMSNCYYSDSLGNSKVFNFARVDSSGWVDVSFDHNTDDVVETVDRYDSARFMVYGRWVSLYDSIPTHQMFRIYEDGTHDTTFQLDPLIEFSGRPLHIQEDGKIIVGRAHMHLAGRSDTTILLRLHQNGSIDSSFNTQSATPIRNFGRSGVYAVCPTTDGGYLIGGKFEKYDAYLRGNIVKTDADGFVDTQYFTGAGIDSTNDHWGAPERVTSIIPGQNDTYYVMGDFLMFDGQPVKPIIRLLGLSHTVGLEEEVEANTLKVYPNPAIDEVTFTWEELSGFDAAVVRLYDLQGQLLAEQAWPPGIQEYTFSLPEYTGAIVYEVTSGEMVERGKLVVWK